MVAAGQLHLSLASRICITEEQAGKAIDARIASHYMPIHSEPEGDYFVELSNLPTCGVDNSEYKCF